MDFVNVDLLSLIIAIGSLIAGFLGKLLASELADWIPSLARHLVDRAVSRLPAQERDRYREEWYAHINDCPGKLGKVWHAVGCLAGSRVIAVHVADDSSSNRDSDHNVQQAETARKVRTRSLLLSRKWVEQWLRYRDATMLSALDDQMLADLGLSKRDVTDALKTLEWSNIPGALGWLAKTVAFFRRRSD
jgi:uncharacterized protein YjiS (DUF1127 family)